MSKLLISALPCELLPRQVLLARAIRRPLPSSQWLSPSTTSRAHSASSTLIIPRSYSTTSAKVLTSSSSPPPKKPKRNRLLRLGGATALLGLSFFAYSSYTNREDPRISPYKFTPLKLVAVRKETNETSVFTLAIPKESLPVVEEWMENPNAVQSLYLMQPDLQIQRPYTPLHASSFSSTGSGEIELVVKRYEIGELSRWLHSLPLGSDVRVRGPVLTWDFGRDHYDEIVFIVGGTGITPASQLISNHLSSPSLPKPKISIIYSSPTPSTMLLKPSLDAFASQDSANVSVRYLVDRLEGGETKIVKNELSAVGRVGVKELKKWIGNGGKEGGRRVVVVCGPEPMVTAIAGPRGRNMSQGPVGGVLGELGYTSNEVVKL